MNYNESIGVLLGYESTDRVCMDADDKVCTANNFKFLKVESTAKMPWISFEAFCGLLPKQTKIGTEY